MPWVSRVEVEEAAAAGPRPPGPPRPPRRSRWTCATAGFEVSWVAEILHLAGLDEAGGDGGARSMGWATVEGLQSEGRVTFAAAEGDAGGTVVELEVEHSLPPPLVDAMGAEGLEGLVRATLQHSMETFRDYAEGSLGGAAAGGGAGAGRARGPRPSGGARGPDPPPGPRNGGAGPPVPRSAGHRVALFPPTSANCNTPGRIVIPPDRKLLMSHLVSGALRAGASGRRATSERARSSRERRSRRPCELQWSLARAHPHS